jgi:hypothetical protein
MPTNWNATSRSLQAFVLIVSFFLSIAVMLVLLEHIKLHTLGNSRYHFDAISLVQVYLCYRLKTACLRIPARYLHIRDFSMFSVCPCVRCASAANIVYRNVDYLEPKRFLLIIFYCDTILIIKILIVFREENAVA